MFRIRFSLCRRPSWLTTDVGPITHSRQFQWRYLQSRHDRFLPRPSIYHHADWPSHQTSRSKNTGAHPPTRAHAQATSWHVDTHCQAFKKTRSSLQYTRPTIRFSGPTQSDSFKWTQLGAHYFLVYLFQILYMFRATMCPSSGELTVSTRHRYFSVCMGGCLVCWLRRVSSQPADQTATHTEWKIPVSHRYGKFSWWWPHSCPKHVEKMK